MPPRTTGVVGVLGLLQVFRSPHTLPAFDPAYAFLFLTTNPALAFVALGAVVLAVMGVEALYADMGHFGASPIRRAWLLFVMPAFCMTRVIRPLRPLRLSFA